MGHTQGWTANVFDYDVIWVDGRRVGYRRAGKGPLVVMLHGSPESSAALASQQEALSQHFTTLAIDTPGNGISDPLDNHDPRAVDYAKALAETLDMLGVERAGFYGFHTGAGTAMAFAMAYPDRVEALALDGYAVWTHDERQTLLNSYLVSFTPEWDGRHLAHLWARLEDQAVFFPWNDRSAEARLNMDLPSLAVQQRRAIEWLGVGDNYIAPYRSAFYRHGEIGPDRVHCPTLIGATPPDPLWTHLERIKARSDHVETQLWPGPRDHAFSQISQFLTRHVSGEPPPLQTASKDPSGVYEGFITTDHGKTHWRGSPDDENTVLYLHGAGESLGIWAQDPTHGFQSDGGFIQLDLAGHGLTRGEIPGDLEGWTDHVEDVLCALDQRVDKIIARGFGGFIAGELLKRQRVEHADLIGLPYPPRDQSQAYKDRFVPDLTPRWDGTHLITAWRWLRRRSLFSPWFEPSKANAICDLSGLDPETLTTRVLDTLRAGEAMTAMFQLQYALSPDRLKQAGPGLNICFHAHHENQTQPDRENAKALGLNVEIYDE